MLELKIGLIIPKWSYIALLKFRMNPMSRLAKNGKNPRWPPADILEKIVF